MTLSYRGGKIRLKKLICWFWRDLTFASIAIGSGGDQWRQAARCAVSVFFGYFLRLKPCPRWNGFMDCTARMWSDDANPCCFFHWNGHFWEEGAHINDGHRYESMHQNGKELGKLWEKFEPSSAGGDLSKDGHSFQKHSISVNQTVGHVISWNYRL